MKNPTVKRLLVMLCAILGVGLLGPAQAHAVSAWSGRNPYGNYSGVVCASNGSQWKSGETAVYDGSTLIGYGYLRYSYTCQANWSEFRYANSTAYNNYSVKPWAWEQNQSGTDQGSPDLWANPVYSNMVDGRSAACAGAHFHHYPSNAWIKWVVFACK